MDVRDLIEQFSQKNKIREDDKILGAIAYGSRVNNTNNDKSDLDILLITNGKESYHERQTIFDVPMEIAKVSVNDIDNLIERDLRRNTRYYTSIFNTGIIFKNNFGVIDQIKDNINSVVIRYKDKRRIKEDKLQEIANFYVSYTDPNLRPEYEDYYFFNLVELIRKNYNYINNCSSLSFIKVYDIYLNNKCIDNYYLLKLPSKQFIDTYLKTIYSLSHKERVAILDELLELINIDPKDLFEDDIYVDQQKYFKKGELEWRLIGLHNKIKKIEDWLLSEHPYAHSAYNVLLYQIRLFYYDYYKQGSMELDEYFSNCLYARDVDQMIKALESIFSLIDKPFKIDYQHYLIKMN